MSIGSGFVVAIPFASPLFSSPNPYTTPSPYEAVSGILWVGVSAGWRGPYPLPCPYKLFDNCRIVVGDEEKSLAGLFSTGSMGENTPRRGFDEVSGVETAVIEQLLSVL